MSNMNSILIKRVYEAPSPSDGLRVLVDRLWPRGLSKAEARIDVWAKEIAPSTKLRKWYAHSPKKWEEFKKRYFLELEANIDMVEDLLAERRKSKITLVFSSKELHLNNAAALKEFLETKLLQ